MPTGGLQTSGLKHRSSLLGARHPKHWKTILLLLVKITLSAAWINSEILYLWAFSGIGYCRARYQGTWPGVKVTPALPIYASMSLSHIPSLSLCTTS